MIEQIDIENLQIGYKQRKQETIVNQSQTGQNRVDLFGFQLIPSEY